MQVIIYRKSEILSNILVVLYLEKKAEHGKMMEKEVNESAYF